MATSKIQHDLKIGHMTINVSVSSTVYNSVHRSGSFGLVKLGLNGISSLPGSSWTKVATLPSGFIPESGSETSAFINGVYGFVAVRTDGGVYVQPTSNVSNGLVRLTIPITYA